MSNIHTDLATATSYTFLKLMMFTIVKSDHYSNAKVYFRKFKHVQAPKSKTGYDFYSPGKESCLHVLLKYMLTLCYLPYLNVKVISNVQDGGRNYL